MSQVKEDPQIPIRGIYVPDIKPGDPLPVDCKGPPEMCTRQQVHERLQEQAAQAAKAAKSQVHEDLHMHKHGEFVHDVQPGEHPPVEHFGSPAEGTRMKIHAQLPRSLDLFLDSDPRFQIIKRALRQTGRMAMLREEGPFTCFFGTDVAYMPPRMPAPQGIEFAEGVVTSDFVDNHIIKGVRFTTKELEHIDTINLTHVHDVPITKHGGHIAIGHSVIEYPNLECTNGVVHAMSHVLDPHVMKRMLGQGR